MTEFALRPRRPTEIIDLAVRLLRRHFGGMLALGLLALLPNLLLQVVLVLTVTSGDPTTIAGRFGSGIVIAYPVLLIFASFVVGALIIYADDALRTGSPTPRVALERAARRTPVILGVSVLTFLCVALAFGLIVLLPRGVGPIGFLLLFIPGVYVVTRLITATPAAAVEPIGAVEALRRAWQRGRGLVGHTFVTLLLLFLLCFVFAIVVGIVAALLGEVLGVARAARGAGVGLGGGLNVAALVVNQLVTTVALAALYPLFTNVLLLLEYDVRVRHEGYDVEAMAAALGTAG